MSKGRKGLRSDGKGIEEDGLANHNTGQEEHAEEHAALPLSAHKAFEELLVRFQLLETTITGKVDNILSRVGLVEKKVLDATEESRELRNSISATEVELATLRKEVQSKDAQITTLREAITDLQNRTRRNVLVFRNIPEGAEGKERDGCAKLIQLFAKDHLGSTKNVEIERAHRAGASRGAAMDNSKPRPIFVAFLRFTDKEFILRQASQHGTWLVNGSECKVIVDEFFSEEVQKERNKMLKVRKDLKEKHREWKMFIKFPARLMYKTPEKHYYEEYKVNTDETGKG